MASMNLPDGRRIKFPDGLNAQQVQSIADAAMAQAPAPSTAQSTTPGKARIQLGERLIEVDDSFLSMSPADQQSTVDEIEASLDGNAPPKRKVFTIQTPSGRELDIEADDEATAIRGAQEWEAKNGATWSPRDAKSDFQGTIPPADLRTPQEAMAHKAKLGAQAAGQGVIADLLGLPADFKRLFGYGIDQTIDLTRRGVNATAIPLANKGLETLGAESRIPQIPQPMTGDELDQKVNDAAADQLASFGFDRDTARTLFGFEAPGGDDIGDAFSKWATGMGYKPAQPENSSEQLGYDATRFGAGAFSMGGALRSGAKAAIAGGKKVSEMPALVRPYVKAPNRALAGDVAGGVGSATALHALDEYGPEAAQDSVLANVLAAALGGHAGNTAATTILSPKTAVQKLAGYVRDPNPVLRDPETGASPRRRNVAQAAEFLQQNTSDPGAAARTIDSNQQFFEQAGGAMPTSGLMSDDLGLQMLEKAVRSAETKIFGERDKALRNSAAQDLAATRPTGGDPFAARTEARTQVNTRRQDANAAVRHAEANVTMADKSERDLMQDYQPFGGAASVASEDLDKVIVDTVLKPYQGRKNNLFDAIDPDGTVPRDLAPLSDVAQALKQSVENLPDSVRRQILPEGMIDDLIERGKDGGTLSFRDMNELRSTLASMERQARTASQLPMAKSLQTLKSAISEDAKALAADGSEAGGRAMEAARFYEQEFAPLFAQGEGGKFRKDFNRDDGFRSGTPPTATAQRFLREGPGGKEAAADLQRILGASPDVAAGAGAARRYVLSDMVRAVGADGKVSETSLRRWINGRSGMLSQIPVIDREVRSLLDEVVNRSKSSSRMRSELEAAAASKARTQRDIDKSALSLLIDADPKRAAESVFRSPDPLGAAKELRKAFKGNVPADRGWRAAVSDYLVETLGTSGKAGVADEIDAVSLEKINSLFRKNDAALREVFGDDVNYLNQARRRLEALSNKSVQAARTGQAPNKSIWHKLLKPLDVVLRLTYGALEGGSRSKKYKVLAEQLPDTTEAANQLIKRAMLDPDVAKHLLTRPVGHGEFLSWNKRLNRLMGWAAAGRMLGEND